MRFATVFVSLFAILLAAGCGADSVSPVVDAGEAADSSPTDVSVADVGTAEDIGEPCPDEAVSVASGPCLRVVCEPAAAPTCWSCSEVADDAQNGDACQAADGLAGVCAAGACEPITCDDADPCTADTRTAEGCETAPLCTERHRGLCEVVEGAPVCGCDEGYGEDGDGGCARLPSGERCDDPIPIEAQTQVLAGTTAGMENDYNSSCVHRTTGDILYSFTIEAPTVFSATMTGADAVLSLRTGCAARLELGCDDDRDGAATLPRALLDPGAYLVLADGAPGDGGPFELSLTFDPDPCAGDPCPEGTVCEMDEELTAPVCVCPEGLALFGDTCVDDPCDPNPCTEEVGRRLCVAELPDAHHCLCAAPFYVEDEGGLCTIVDEYAGDTCEAPIPIDLSAGPYEREIPLAAMGNDFGGSCGGGGQDAVLSVTLDEPAYLVVQAWGPDTVLYVRSVCGDHDTELPGACNDDSDPPGSNGSRVGVAVEEPGTLYLFVDGYSRVAGDATIHVEAIADPCADGGGCNPDQTCVRSYDWSSVTCRCPDGTVESGETCVDDPCEPNPCAGTDHPRCERELPDAFTCACRPGYIDTVTCDAAAVCEPDPDGKAWTVLVYLNADNDLETSGLADVDEMASVGSNAAVDIVVQLDTHSGPARRLFVQPGEAVVEQELGEINMGDADELARFGEWAAVAHPARRYALILWNHGSGWQKAARSATSAWKSFSTDESHGGASISIANGAYAGALERITAATGGPLDLLSFDACLMGMWEVAHATAPYASTFVASEETIPTTGFPYDVLLQGLVDDPSLDPIGFGELIVSAYHDSIRENATLSLVDLEGMPEIDAALSVLADALLAQPESFGAFSQVLYDLSWYSYSPYTDLKNLAQRVVSAPGIPAEAVEAAQGLVDSLDAAVVASETNGAEYVSSHGLSIYVPMDLYDPAYDDASWSLATTWDDFLRALAAR